MLKRLYIVLFLLTALTTVNAQSVRKITDTIVYTVVDLPPQFPGGDVGLLKFFSKNFRFPDSTDLNNYTGRVVLQLLIEKDGRVSKSSVYKLTKSTVVSRAVARTFEKSPRWKPGIKNGKPVRSFCLVPFSCIMPAEE
ncbi:hypothetical protein D0C36_02100 [Mucilaginibacter conchicola]|uniref:TonB C-terminal domain-containing protein n=1 Tax=Mucilaginibacter conchicola TaxID=2303333 RepID=A0A372NW67_9SPHI|nr:energy transducer TonB [Mucilaginibacter conchicola]RFZ94370.1 hypothetical protein D0C36_02100 [Mucilaginibacter conchicola]